MNVLSIFGITIIAAILSVLLGQYKSEYRIFLIIIAAVFIILYAVSYINSITGEISGLVSEADISASYLKILLKASGICVLSQLSVNICKDCGEVTLAFVSELVGKAVILLLSLPLFAEIVGIIKEILIL